MLDKLYYMLDSTYSSYAAPLSYAAHTWALHCCIPPSFAAPYWASMHPFFDLRCTLRAPLHPASSTAPCELHSTLWATLHNTELTCILLSYAETFLNYITPYWATQHPLSYAAPYWAMLYTTELRCTLLSYLVPSIATQQPVI